MATAPHLTAVSRAIALAMSEELAWPMALATLCRLACRPLRPLTESSWALSVSRSDVTPPTWATVEPIWPVRLRSSPTELIVLASSTTTSLCERRARHGADVNNGITAT